MTFVPMEMTKWKSRNWILLKSRGNGMTTLKSGLVYKVLKRRLVGVSPVETSICKCHYSGSLMDGTIFDSTYERNEPVSFKPSQVIPGWKEALLMMKEGEKWELYIPYDLAYGKKGQDDIIPPYESLKFIIEIIEITGDKKQRDYSAAGMEKERLEKEEKYKLPTVVTMRYNPGNNSKKKNIFAQSQQNAKDIRMEDYLKDPSTFNDPCKR